MSLIRVPAELEALEAVAELSPVDVHFAATLGELAHEGGSDVLLAAALASRRAREGHVCVPLADVAGLPLPSGGSWPPFEAWLASLRCSPLVSDGTERRPLVLDDEGRLYLHRYWEHEQHFAALLRDRMAPLENGARDAAVVHEGLSRLFRVPPDAPLDDQQVAVLVALVQRFAVISGGPGTGKTSTVARLLTLLVESALAAGHKPPRMLLLAPTGKAAGRLVESIRQAKTRLQTSAEVLALVPEEASTIHRALGVRQRTGRYWHDASRPLVADLVLVDEASMVDLALMRHLVEAVPRGARLILLGDRHQLASVEAGSVLGELCAAADAAAVEASAEGKPGGVGRAASATFGPALCDAVQELSGRTLPRAAGPVALLRDHVVELTKSYRFDDRSAIGRLAAAVRDGDVEGVFAVLEQGGDVSWSAESPGPELSDDLAERVVLGFRPLFEAENAAAALLELSRFRVLCAHRRGWAGVEHLNEKVRAHLARAGLITERGEFYRGRPVLVTRNDYSVGLFNGDVGLAWDEEPGRVTVHFETAHVEHAPLERTEPGRSSRTTRNISPARLPAHESAFVLSIHKSQGSEHDDVVVVLPDADSRLLSRELLYTAITRAKQHVRIYGTRQAIELAVQRRVARASGLAGALAKEIRRGQEELRPGEPSGSRP